MIGKVITHLLKDNAALLALLPGENIFPYVMNEGTLLPAIIYTVDSLVPEYTKDGWVKDECTFSVTSFSSDYAILQNVADEIRTALELKKGTNEGITTRRIELSGQLEGYSLTEEAFLNKLTFSTIITGY